MEASKIKGFMIEKKFRLNKKYGKHYEATRYQGFDDGVDQQCKKQIGMNRERLAIKLWNFKNDERSWKEVPDNQKFVFYAQAEEIIADEENILEFKNA